MIDSPSAVWALDRGARPIDGGVRFSVWAPRAERVSVRIVAEPSFDRELQPLGDGSFAASIAEAGPGAEYVYVLDGERARPDPVSRHQPGGVHRASRVVDPAAFRWTDAGWPGLTMKDLVLYELHVGTFTDAGSFDAVCEHLHGL
ncbi:MAG TPA: malto-oligosyltrehalose trehalohydrolase, partial [Candidatus Binatia bacterium]|nr:malto-oligosyltrehalose trehalohydrolase [Candidatus Binatia bacterium]